MARATMTPADIRDRLVAQRVVPVLRLVSSEEAHARRFLEPGAGVVAA